MAGFKTIARDLLPTKFQVPFKYAYGRLTGGLEPEMEVLSSLVKSGDRVIDVGGNRGVYAYRLAQLGAQVEVFEPNPVCLRVLRSWASAKSAVNVHAVALSAKEGTAELLIPVDQQGVEHDASASLERRSEDAARVEKVPTATLDSFGFDAVTLIKIDVEGHEQSVIKGAEQTIKRCKPAIVVEVEQRHLEDSIRDVLRGVEDLGYSGFFLNKNSWRPVSQFNVEVHQSLASFHDGDGLYINNFLFLCREKIAEGRYSAITGPA